MEDKFKNYLFAFILVSAFGMLILTTVIEGGNNYSLDTSKIAGGSLSITQFNESISNLQTESENLKKSFDDQSIWSSIAGVVVEGFFGIAGSMFNMIFVPLNLIINILIDIFGIPIWFSTVIVGLLILGVMLSIWRLIKVGD